MPGRSRTTARHRLPALFAFLVALAAWVPALADGRAQFLAERLKYPPSAGQPDDFRVRTNAALALGSTDDDDAVAPLCAGLADPSELVRQAVAVALKRLARGTSADCLRKRAAVETSGVVKQQIQRAIEAVEAAMSSNGSNWSEPARSAQGTSSARYYVSISPVVNRTTRPSVEIARLVREALASKLAELGGYQVAPAGESSGAARAVIAKHKLKGFYLAVSVDQLDYSEGGLRVRVKIAVFSYPGKDLRGEVPAGATLPGARPGDNGAEDQLIGTVAARAAELFAQNFR
jgi:HEAT repeat protein